MVRKLSVRQAVFDALLTLVWAALGYLVYPQSGLVDLIVVVIISAALGLRRFAPGIALATAWAGCILQMLTLRPPAPVDLAVLAVLYATASYGTALVRRLGLISALVGAAVVTVYLVIFPAVFPVDGSSLPALGLDVGGLIPRFVLAISVIFVGFAVLFTLSWTLGLLVRTARLARESRIAKQVAERSVLIEQERNRIARDMHDVVAHSLAVVIAQADGARYTKDPVASSEALATISATAREALSDVRVLLAQLRHNQDDGPQPRIADLDRLLAQVRDAGLTVALDEQGARPELHASQSLAVYRILQEALTNALRHGDSAKPVQITIDWADDAVELEVANAVRDREVREAGHGLTGMRERAVLIGGEFSAGIEHDRYVVRATVPITPEQRTPSATVAEVAAGTTAAAATGPTPRIDS